MTDRVRQGQAPGTERWLVHLRGRSFVLRNKLDELRAAQSEAARQQLWAALRSLVVQDQDAAARRVVELGGRVREQYWLMNSLVAEINPRRLAELRTHPQVIRVTPDELRESGSIATAPRNAAAPRPPLAAPAMDASDSIDNHNFTSTRSTLPHEGAGAVFAIFDSGVDRDQDASQGANPNRHLAFRDKATGTVDRVLAEGMAGTIDCNGPGGDGYCPNNPAIHFDARHGTGVAGIAVGRGDLPPNPRFSEGHAPGASIISISISNPPQPPSLRWSVSSTSYLNAIQMLTSLLLGSGLPGAVLNISWDGWSDPQDPVEQSLDLLERNLDCLTVALASNTVDTTVISHGFVSGLSVGNVHKYGFFSTAQLGRFPQRFSSRGPLFSDSERYYPDLCASGASQGVDVSLSTQQIRMPLVDHDYVTTPNCRNSSGSGLGQVNYNAAGSSMASPQVAGAAVLYRAERPLASAQETRAALLLCSIDPLLEARTAAPPTAPAVLHTYIGRNAVGVGYVRDDFLARYAKRNVLDQPLGQEVVVANSTPIDVAYTGLTANALYAVCIAWPRMFPANHDPASGIPVDWANMDLEVLDSSASQLLARSDSTRNSYERLVFRLPAGMTSVILRIRGSDLGGFSVPAYLAARNISGDSYPPPINKNFVSRVSHNGYVASLAQPAGCRHATPDQTTLRVVPNTYARAYGSLAFQRTVADISSDPFHGQAIAAPDWFHTVYHSDRIFLPNEAQPMTIRGLSFRSWRPFGGSNGTWKIKRVILYSFPSIGPPYPSMTPLLVPNPTGQTVAADITVEVFKADWSARSWDTWPVIIPFATPFTLPYGDGLGIWIERDPMSNVSCIVDAVDDDLADTPCASRAANEASGVDGRAPIVGLFTGQSANLNPLLLVYGFPKIWPDLAPPTIENRLMFQVRQAGPSAAVYLALGLSNPNLPLGPCSAFTSADLLTLGPKTATTMGNAEFVIPFPYDPTLLHRHIYAQAVCGSSLLTNGARLTFGGILP